MATRPKSGEQEIVQDARDVYREGTSAAAKRAFADADRNRTKKLFPAGFWSEFKTALDAAPGAQGAATVTRTAAKKATRSEESARAAVYAELTALRATIKDAYDTDEPDDVAIREAFQVGNKLSTKSTPALLTAANAMVDALGAREHAARAKAAGITAARKRTLVAARDALAAADSSQGAAAGTRRESSRTKVSVLRQLRAFAAKVRSAVKVAAAGDAALLARFKTRVARVAPKRKAAPALAAATAK